MESRFDEMTKVLAEGIPRREALWRLGGLFGGAVLATLGWGRNAKADSDASDCAHLCNERFDGGREREECKKDCRAAGGPAHYCFDQNGALGICPAPRKCCCGKCRDDVSGIC